MTKEMKTAEQLAAMIEARIGVQDLLVTVRKDHAFGWYPTIVSAPGNGLGFQRRVEEIARNLQVQFELRD